MVFVLQHGRELSILKAMGRWIKKTPGLFIETVDPWMLVQKTVCQNPKSWTPGRLPYSTMEFAKDS